MRVRGVPRFLPDGRFKGFIGCFTDITDQHAVALDVLRQKRCTAAVAEAAGFSWQILDAACKIEPGGRCCGDACDAAEACRAAIREAIATRAKSCAGGCTFTPVLSEQRDLLAIAATKH